MLLEEGRAVIDTSFFDALRGVVRYRRPLSVHYVLLKQCEGIAPDVLREVRNHMTAEDKQIAYERALDIHHPLKPGELD